MCNSSIVTRLSGYVDKLIDAEPNVGVVELTLDQARSFFNGDETVDQLLEPILDDVQAHVFAGDYDEGFVIIRISRSST